MHGDELSRLSVVFVTTVQGARCNGGRSWLTWRRTGYASSRHTGRPISQPWVDDTRSHDHTHPHGQDQQSAVAEVRAGDKYHKDRNCSALAAVAVAQRRRWTLRAARSRGRSLLAPCAHACCSRRVDAMSCSSGSDRILGYILPQTRRPLVYSYGRDLIREYAENGGVESESESRGRRLGQ